MFLITQAVIPKFAHGIAGGLLFTACCAAPFNFLIISRWIHTPTSLTLHVLRGGGGVDARGCTCCDHTNQRPNWNVGDNSEVVENPGLMQYVRMALAEMLPYIGFGIALGWRCLQGERCPAGFAFTRRGAYSLP